MGSGDPLQPVFPRRPLVSAEPHDLDSLAARLGHRFARREVLEIALTHASAGGARRRDTYQRLEFLGDRVLGLVVADLLMRRHRDETEGDLARRHARLVERRSLVEVAEEIGLGAYLRMSDGEAGSGARDNPAILADAMEAVIGAIYRDAGLEAAAAVIERLWSDMLTGQEEPPLDPKTGLQEWAQGGGLALPAYRIVRRAGPDHEPVFTVEVKVGDRQPVQATGGSRRAAERAAAVAMLAAIEAEGHADDGN